MYARFLIPGSVVNVDGRVMSFVKRVRLCGLPTQNVFFCRDYIGLNGPTDKGLCTMTDHYFRTRAKPATVMQSRQARAELLAAIPQIAAALHAEPAHRD